MNLTTRRLKKGRAIYNGTVRYLTTLYPTKAQARRLLPREGRWRSGVGRGVAPARRLASSRCWRIR